MLFEGNFDESSAPVAGAFRFDFTRNLYWSDLPGGGELGTAAVFGGVSRPAMSPTPASHLTWGQWRALHGGGQDQGSVLARQHPFTSANWSTTLDVAVPIDSVAVLSLGWEQIDTTTAGPRAP